MEPTKSHDFEIYEKFTNNKKFKKFESFFVASHVLVVTGTWMIKIIELVQWTVSSCELNHSTSR